MSEERKALERCRLMLRLSEREIDDEKLQECFGIVVEYRKGNMSREEFVKRLRELGIKTVYALEESIID